MKIGALIGSPDVLGCLVTLFSDRATRVLFVDDDAATRDGYAAHLTKLGYEVIGAGSGHHALLLASTWAPDVIVLDLGLPDVDGWEVARRLKDGPTTSAIPIVAVTGADLPHERVSAMRAGCDRHLAKPCAPADLVDAIERCVRASSL
jgi:CheY-like chemotaxis protein